MRECDGEDHAQRQVKEETTKELIPRDRQAPIDSDDGDRQQARDIPLSNRDSQRLGPRDGDPHERLTSHLCSRREHEHEGRPEPESPQPGFEAISDEQRKKSLAERRAGLALWPRHSPRYP